MIDLGYWHSINIVTFLSVDRIGLLRCPNGIESRSVLRGMQEFWRISIRKMVLYCFDKLLSSADVLPNVCCII